MTWPARWSALGAGQIHRDALAPDSALNRLTMHLQAAHAEQIVAGKQRTCHRLYLAGERSAGDQDAMALQTKARSPAGEK